MKVPIVSDDGRPGERTELQSEGDAVETEQRAPWFARRMGWSARRIIGVDLARGIAMIGMFGAHLQVRRSVTVGDPSTYLSLVHGRSAILFALLAGVSLAIVTGGSQPITDRDAVVSFRVRTLVRAVLLFVLGGLLSMLGTRVAVILEAYAALFVLALLVLSWSTKRLWIAVGVLVVLGPIVTIGVRTALNGLGIPPIGAWNIAFGEYYPVATWIVFPLAGIAIGRTDLRSVRTAVRLVVGGAVAAVVGYVAGHLASESSLASSPPPLELHVNAELPPAGEVLAAVPRTVLIKLLTADPHTGTPFEIVGSGGFVIALLGLCLLVSRSRARFALAPLAAVGAMSLTVYSAHIVALRILHDDLFADLSLRIFGQFTFWALVGATAWRLALGKGPLERAIGWAAEGAVRYADRSGDRPSRTAEPGLSSTSS